MKEENQVMNFCFGGGSFFIMVDFNLIFGACVGTWLWETFKVKFNAIWNLYNMLN